MTQQCPCCAWIVHVPDEAGEALVACRECGQCLRLPEPWAKATIPACDMRSLVSPLPNDRLTAGSDPLSLVPAPLTFQVPRGQPRENPQMLLLGLAGIVMGVAVLIASLWPDGPGWRVTPLWRLLAFGGSGLILVSGISLVHQYFRKKRRASRARTLIPGELFPPEAYDLGPPFALHQRGSLARWTLIGMGVILLMMAATCAAMFIRGEAREGRVLELACLGLPGGVFTIWKGCTSRGLRILVCPEGFVLCQGYRGEVWRWDQIEAVFLKPDPNTQPVTGHVYTLRREDGERFTFSADTEYVENQLGIRVQYETSRRMLPRLRATLAAGGTVDFGPLQLSTAGVHKDQQMVPWSAISGVTVEAGQLRIRKQDQTWAIGIERLANVGVFWNLATQLRRATAVAHGESPSYGA